MTMGKGAAHDDRLFADWARLPTFEKSAKPLDEFGRPVGEIKQCAFFDLTVLAIGFAQQGRIRYAWLNGSDTPKEMQL